MPIDRMVELQKRIRLRNKNPGRITEKELSLIYDFSKKITAEMGGFIQAIVLFGSVSREKGKRNDVDLMVITDDTTFKITPEIVGSYNLGLGKILAELNAVDTLHITTVSLTNFWDAVRLCDPVMYTIIKDCKPIVDTGFIKPLKKLLEMGRIRPSTEAINANMQKAKALLRGAEIHVLAGIDDLYWAVSNSSHSALMSAGITPKEPKKIPIYLEKELNVPKKYIETYLRLYTMMKKIVTRQIKRVDPDKLESLMLKADEYIKYMQGIINKNRIKMKSMP